MIRQCPTQIWLAHHEGQPDQFPQSRASSKYPTEKDTLMQKGVVWGGPVSSEQVLYAETHTRSEITSAHTPHRQRYSKMRWKDTHGGFWGAYFLKHQGSWHLAVKSSHSEEQGCHPNTTSFSQPSGKEGVTGIKPSLAMFLWGKSYHISPSWDQRQIIHNVI